MLGRAPAAHAGRNDLALAKMCPLVTPAAGSGVGPSVPDCAWVSRQPGTGLVQGISFINDSDAETNFRSVMSELGAAIAPRIMGPADTLGFSGFQIAADYGTTSISNTEPFWRGTEGSSPLNPTTTRPDAWLRTAGVFVRKGLWFPLPAMELGGGVLNVLESRMFAFQAYAKLGLHEGFHSWPIPSLAVRGGVSHLTGAQDARLDVFSLDLIASKSFGVLGTARLSPYAGWSYLYMKAKSGLIDATPACDAYAPAGPACAPAQAGTRNDELANFAFPDQDGIQRQRFFAGLKVKFAWFFVSGQYETVTRGHSRDERKANGARDRSQRQETVTLHAGFDF